MTDFPTHIVETDRYGWNHGGRHRFAYGESSVRRIIAGLRGRYDVRGGFTARVFVLPGLEDVTAQFIAEESKDAPPF